MNKPEDVARDSCASHGSSALICETCGGRESVTPRHIGYAICESCYRFDGISRHISPMVKPKPPCRVRIGSKVVTAQGIGLVVDKEPIRDRFRWGVELGESPFFYPVAYYWTDELSVL